MASNPVIAGNVLAAGLNDRWKATYEGALASYPWLDKIMDRTPTSDKRTETYAYFKSAPQLERKPDAQNIASENFDADQYSVTNFEVEKRIPWRIKDRQDDMTRSLMTHVEMLARDAATYDARIAGQMLSAGTAAALLETVPNAPDGAAIFATTAGGAATRFGVTDGNLLTGSGVSTAEQITTDMFAGIAQFQLMQDTKGRRLWSDEVLGGEYFVLYAPSASNSLQFVKAFKQMIVASTAGAAGAGVSNPITATGLNITPMPFFYYSGGDWSIHLVAAPIKALFKQTRIPFYTTYAVEENSDTARDSGVEAFYVKGRLGFGANLAASALKINN